METTCHSERSEESLLYNNNVKIPRCTRYNIVFIILFSVFLVLTANQVFASTAKEELSKTEKEINEANERSKKLAAENKILAKKYAELTKKMVKTATDLQASEAKLSAIEEILRIINEQISSRTESLIAHQKDLSVMVQAAIKLSQTPKEAIILMPGNMMNNMKASRALKMTVDSIKIQSENIHTEMVELESLKQKASDNKESALTERGKLEEQRALLKTQVAEHNAMQKKLNTQQKEVTAKTQSLGRKAKDLKDLIASLEKEEQLRQREEDEIKSDTEQPEGEKGELRSFKAAKGYIRVPAAGKLTQKYAETKLNETSKGIIITTRPMAQVTAPYDAEVLFTGPFMEYGSMIILRHSDGFHTLLAGMEKIDASVGDFLLEGEPIGVMGDEDEDNRLYMELRSNNQPIDPTPWVRGLSKR